MSGDNEEWIEVLAQVRLIEQPDGSWLVDRIETTYDQGEIVQDDERRNWEN